MKTGKRHIENGNQYNYLFPTPKGENKVIKKVAGLEHTIQLMKKVTAQTLDDTLKLSETLIADTEKQTCQNIWDFCFNYLQYTKDEMGKEQVRRPARSWQDRKQGVDCDCMSVFIGSILTNLEIPYSLRLTKYSSTEFEHVYPIAHTNNGVLIMDAVVHKFNREVEYSAKKDISMELQYLNGADDSQTNENEDFDQFDELNELEEIFDNDYPMDAQGLIMDEELLGLDGKMRERRKARKAKRKARRAEIKKLPKKERFKARLKQGLFVVNRLNPGAALLRAGVLASMKLNVMKAASKLRFGYWMDADALKNNMEMGKFGQLKRIREKMEKIFFGAGGKTENLKKAILTGRGNRDRRVVLNGLGEIIENISDEDNLRTILGDELYNDELAEVEGVNGLGAIATGAAVATASGLIGTIAGLIKKLGSLFKKGSPQAEQEVVQENTENEEEKTRKFSFKNLISKIRNRNKANDSSLAPSKAKDVNTELDPLMDDFTEDDFSLRENQATDNTTDDKSEKKGFVEWIKENPLKTAGIVTVVAGGTILAVRAAKKTKTKKSLSGTPSKKRATKPKSKKLTSKKGNQKSGVKRIELL